MLVKMGSSSPRIRGEHFKKIFELPPPCYFRVFFSGFFVMLWYLSFGKSLGCELGKLDFSAGEGTPGNS